MTSEELNVHFGSKDQQLLRIIVDTAEWLDPFGYEPRVSPVGGGRLGDAVKFCKGSTGPMLFSLQFNKIDGPFLYFKWTKKTIQALGVYDELVKALFDDIRPIIHDRSRGETLTEVRLHLSPSDHKHVAVIHDILTPIIRSISNI